MDIQIIYHYPPELFNLLVDTIPLLFRGKKDVLIFFKGTGVNEKDMLDLIERVDKDRQNITKYEIVKEILVRINEKGETTLRERREILKRVTEFEDFSSCWPGDQLKAKGLVSEIRRVVNVKDSFARMRGERESERQKHIQENERKIALLNEQNAKLAKIKKDFSSLFSEANPQKRGKVLEDILNRLFKVNNILIREAFTRVGSTGEGVVEQIDGVIEIDGEIYLVEMKWWDKPLGNGEVSQHLVRVFTRQCARGILISYSGYTSPAITTCKESLSQMVIVLCTLQEIMGILDGDGNLKELLKQKIHCAVVDKNPMYSVAFS